MNRDFSKSINLYALLNTPLLWLIASPFLLTILQSQSLFQNSIIRYDNFLLKSFIISFAIVNYLSFLALYCLSMRLFLALLPIKTRLLTFVAICSFTLLQLAFLVDLMLFKHYQFHLNLQLLSLIKDSLIHQVFELSSLEQGLIVGLVFLLFIAEVLLLKLAKNKAEQNTESLSFLCSSRMWTIALASQGLCLLLLGLSLMHQNPILLQQTQSIPFYQPTFQLFLPTKLGNAISSFTNRGINLPVASSKTLKYPKERLRCQSQEMQKNLILILVDALRFDAVNAKSMPHLTKRLSELIEFKHYFSGGNATQPGLFSLFYGLPPNYWQAILEEKKAPLLHTILKEQGYLRAAIWSAQFTAPPFDKTILQDLDLRVSTHSISDNVKEWDELTSNKAVDFITLHKGKPFYLQLFYRAPHAYCYNGPFSNHFKPIASPCQRLFKHKIKNEYYNRYRNAVYFTDGEIEKIITTLKTTGQWDNSVVIISSDHGEEFDDNNLGFWGHTSNFTRFQTQVPLLIHWPGKKPKKVLAQKSHYDLNTTLMQEFLSCKNNVSDYSLGQSLFSPKESSPLWVASYNNVGLITKHTLFTLSRQGALKAFSTNGQEKSAHKDELDLLEKSLEQFNDF